MSSVYKRFIYIYIKFTDIYFFLSLSGRGSGKITVINKLNLYCSHLCVYSCAGYQMTASRGRCDWCVNVIPPFPHVQEVLDLCDLNEGDPESTIPFK